MNLDITLWNYLSNAWRRYYETTEISKFWEGILRLAGDVRLQSNQADMAKSIATAFDFWSEEWYEVRVDPDTEDIDDSMPGYPYAFELDADIIEMEKLVDYPTNETYTLFQGSDYTIGHKKIYFKKDPRNILLNAIVYESKISDIDVRKDSTVQVDRIAGRLYAPKCKYRLNVLYKNFGYQIGLKDTGSYLYNKELQGIYYALSQGASIKFLTIALNILLGTKAGWAFALEGDLVREIDRGTHFTKILTVNKRYILPYFLDPIVSKFPFPVPAEFDLDHPGRISEFSPFSNGIQVHDYTIDKDWYGYDYDDHISAGRLIVYLDALMRAGPGLGTFSDNGIWDDGEQLILPDRYTTHLDDIVPPLPSIFMDEFDDGGYFDFPYGYFDNTPATVFIDPALVHLLFDLVKDKSTIVEAHKSAFSYTTINQQNVYHVLKHFDFLFRSPAKERFLERSDSHIRHKDSVEFEVSEVFSQDIYFDVTETVDISKWDNPEYDPKYVKDYEENIVPVIKQRNIEIEPVDLDDGFSRVIDGYKPPGTNLIVTTTEAIAERIEKKISSNVNIYLEGPVAYY